MRGKLWNAVGGSTGGVLQWWGGVDVDRRSGGTEATQRAGAEWQRAVQSSDPGVLMQRQLGCPNSCFILSKGVMGCCFCCFKESNFGNVKGDQWQPRDPLATVGLFPGPVQAPSLVREA